MSLRRKPPRRDPDDLRIVVRGGFSPETIDVPAWKPLRIVFRREETGLASETVIFRSLGLSATLPPHQDVPLDLPALKPGQYEFTGQLESLRGRLVAIRVDGRRVWR